MENTNYKKICWRSFILNNEYLYSFFSTEDALKELTSKLFICFDKYDIKILKETKFNLNIELDNNIYTYSLKNKKVNIDNYNVKNSSTVIFSKQNKQIEFSDIKKIIKSYDSHILIKLEKNLINNHTKIIDNTFNMNNLYSEEKKKIDDSFLINITSDFIYSIKNDIVFKTYNMFNLFLKNRTYIKNFSEIGDLIKYNDIRITNAFNAYQTNFFSNTKQLELLDTELNKLKNTQIQNIFQEMINKININITSDTQNYVKI